MVGCTASALGNMPCYYLFCLGLSANLLHHLHNNLGSYSIHQGIRVDGAFTFQLESLGAAREHKYREHLNVHMTINFTSNIVGTLKVNLHIDQARTETERRYFST
eukprot:scaffold15864_cov104-Skeletonema_dohrnii-CCMP3373.AAC.1